MSSLQDKIKTCDKCKKIFKSVQGLIRHKSRHDPCNEIENLVCDKCNKIFKQRHHLIQHLNRKTACVKASKIDEEKELILFKHNLDLEKKIKIIETEIKYKKELIELQKEKELAVEEKKLERKKQVSNKTTINNIIQQVNIHFPISTMIPATYDNCLEKIVNPFIEQIVSGSYNSYKLVYESSLDKLEIATTIMKDIFQDEKRPNTHNMVYITEQDIFMVALHKAWVCKQFDYIAKIMTETFKKCFSAIRRRIGEPRRCNFMSDKTYITACNRYEEITELSRTDISAEELENISKEGLGIDDIILGKKMLRI